MNSAGFYYLRSFHDMRCKYGLVLSVIRQQMNRELQTGEVYIMMSKDCRRYAFTATTGTCTAFMKNVTKKDYSILEYLKKFFEEIAAGNRDYGKLMPSTIGINKCK